MPELDAVLTQRLLTLEEQGLARHVMTTNRTNFPQVIRNGKPLISFACNDYLGLSHEPQLVQAGLDALKHYGAGAGASRLITGNDSLYADLEAQLAAMKQTQAACVFGSGYLANLGVITALMGKGDLIIADKFAHACMIDAAQLSGATFKRFAHNDLAHLETLLHTHRGDFGDCLILSETVFSMDGDIAPMAEIVALAKRYDAWVMSDDAHGLGVVDSVATDIQMGTLSKAVGCYGGYVCGSRTLIDYVMASARSLIFTTALPPAVLASSLAALQMIEAQPQRGKLALENARLFTSLLGLPMAQSLVVPVIIGDAAAALNASMRLADEGFLVSAIRPPTVPAGTSRLRFTFSTLHQQDDIKHLAECIKRHGWLKHIDHQRMDATG